MFRPLAALLGLLVICLSLPADRPARAWLDMTPEPDLGSHDARACRIVCRAHLALIVMTAETRAVPEFRAAKAMPRSSVRVATLGPAAFGVIGPGAPPEPGVLPSPLLLPLSPARRLSESGSGESRDAGAPARTAGVPSTVLREFTEHDSGAGDRSPLATEIPVPTPIATLIAAIAMLALLARRSRCHNHQLLRTRLAG